MMEDKRDIKEAIREKKSLTELAKEKDINLQNSYDIKASPDGFVYYFTTRFNVTYTTAAKR
jgi:hypothetical protein